MSNVITSGALPRDANGVYMVLTSSNINETSGFCTQYCGFHTRATLGGVDIKYAFVGNPDRCPSGCEAQTTGPNSPSTGVGGADGMINVISHEQFEAITDPDLNAWFDASGQEDCRQVQLQFRSPASRSACNRAGSKFNQTFGGNNWLCSSSGKTAAAALATRPWAARSSPTKLILVYNESRPVRPDGFLNFDTNELHRYVSPPASRAGFLC